MGMYTELVMATEIRDDPVIIPVLKFMAGSTLMPKPQVLPEHDFFKTDRWRWLFQMDSHYFVPMSVVKFEFNGISGNWCLISRSDLKNYNGEIEKFIDWITPYIAGRDMIGYSRYEEDREPTIYYGAS